MGKIMKRKPPVRVAVSRRLRARRIAAGFDTARAFAQHWVLKRIVILVGSELRPNRILPTSCAYARC